MDLALTRDYAARGTTRALASAQESLARIVRSAWSRTRSSGYIGAFGTDLGFRKHRLEDGKTRPGNALMRGALEAIQAIFSGPPMVYVFSKVKRSSAASERLHDEHGFEDMDTGDPQGEHFCAGPPSWTRRLCGSRLAALRRAHLG